MEVFFQKLLNTVLSEYGAFVVFLLFLNAKFYLDKQKTEDKYDNLTNKLLDVVSGNTEAMTNLVNKIDHQKEVYNAKNN